MEILVNSCNTYSPDRKYSKISGVYKLLIGNKIYIGSAVCLYSRINIHKFQLLKHKHYNILVQRKFDKVKELNYEIIEYCSKEDLTRVEQYYLDTLKPELNLDKIANSRLGSKLSKESIEKRRNTIKNNGGFKHSKESKLKIAKTMLGTKRPKEVTLKTTGSNNPNSLFNDEDINNILELLSKNIMIKDIANMYNCNRNTIARIKSNKTYKNRK